MYMKRPDGKKWWIVGPRESGEETAVRQRKAAAEITRIVKDPFDAQHSSYRQYPFY